MDLRCSGRKETHVFVEADREDYLVRGRIQGVQAFKTGALQTRENRTLRRCPFAYRKKHEVSRQALSPERLAVKLHFPPDGI